MLFAIGGCQPRSQQPDLATFDTQREVLIVDSTGTRTRVWADWDDLDAALDVGLSEIEAAVLKKDQPEPGLIVCTLVTIRDDQGVIQIRQLDPLPTATPDPSIDTAPDSPAPGPVTIEIRASIGRFGERRQAERTLVQTIRRRLVQLRGRDAAPVR